jgi:adenylate cyclase
LKAQALVDRPGRAADSKAIELFDQVIAKDAAFAPAYAGLANRYASMSMSPYQQPSPTSTVYRISSDTALSSMRRAAVKALELDPLLAEAHAAMGLVHSRDLEWNEAEKSFRRALELNPTLTQVYVNYSVSTLRPLGKQEEAERLIRIGMRSDPLSLELLRELANVQIEAGRFEAALASVRQVLARDPEFLVIPQLPRALILSGRLTEAIAFLERAGLPGLDQYLAFAYVKAGRRVDAEKVALANRGYPFREAIIYAALGNRDRSFEALERMAVSEPQRLGLTLRFPELSELRDDPRFDALRKKLRLP